MRKRRLNARNPTEKVVNAGIYKLRNIKTGHTHFGSTWDLQNAKNQCMDDLSNQVHPNGALNRTMDVYGGSDIRFTVLERISVETEFNFRELEEELMSR